MQEELRKWRVWGEVRGGQGMGEWEDMGDGVERVKRKGVVGWSSVGGGEERSGVWRCVGR